MCPIVRQARGRSPGLCVEALASGAALGQSGRDEEVGVLDDGQQATEAQPREAVTSAQPRAVGAVRLRAVRRDQGSAIGGLRQEGSLKLLFPQVRGAALEAVMLNTAGGLTGGDRMALEAEVAEGAALCLSTQAAERAYRAVGEVPARVDTRLEVAAGGRLHWLPQETLLYDGCALERRLTLDVAADATALVAEAVILGRRAMGETVRRGGFREAWDVRRDGRRVFADRLRLEGDMAATLARSGPGLATFATLLFVAPEAGARLAEVRRLLPDSCGASLVEEGVILVRLLAPDGFALRRDLIPIIEALARAPLPKVWRL